VTIFTTLKLKNKLITQRRKPIVSVLRETPVSRNIARNDLSFITSYTYIHTSYTYMSFITTYTYNHTFTQIHNEINDLPYKEKYNKIINKLRTYIFKLQ